MMSSSEKRPPPGEGMSPLPAPKRFVLFEPLKIGKVSTLEEMDVKVLRFQHKQIKRQLASYNKQELTLRRKIEQLEKRQVQDDAVINVMSRYWNQLDEDVQILLKRVIPTTATDGIERKTEVDETSQTTFLVEMSTWDQDEISEKLANKVKDSMSAVGKLVEALHVILAQNGNNDAFISQEESTEVETSKAQMMNASFHGKHREMSLKMKEMNDNLITAATKRDELKNEVDDLNWEVSKLIARNDKLVAQLQELTESRNSFQQQIQKLTAASEDHSLSPKGDLCLPSHQQIEATDRTVSHLTSLENEIDVLKQLAKERLDESVQIRLQNKELQKTVNSLRIDSRHIPANVIVETAEYKCLQSEFSILYHDHRLVRKAFDDLKQLLVAVKAEHTGQLEDNEKNKVYLQEKMRDEMLRLEKEHETVLEDFSCLKIEFEKIATENKRVLKLNNEIHETNKTLESYNTHVKGEIQRYRQKFKESCMEIEKLKRYLDEWRKKAENNKKANVNQSTAGSSMKKEEEEAMPPEIEVTKKPAPAKKEDNDGSKVKDYEGMKQRQKVLEKQLSNLQHAVSTQKVQEEVLSKEMDLLGQAFEDLRDQNARLLLQLNEKEDSIFKLMIGRVKVAQQEKIEKEERSRIQMQNFTLLKGLEERDIVIRKAEEMERLFLANEKESAVKHPFTDINRQKAVEAAQVAVELQMKLDETDLLVKNVKEMLAEKTVALEDEAFKSCRLTEEINLLRRKMGNISKMVTPGGKEEVLEEEIRELKETLNCPSCKVKKKDAVIVKCFHVFCFDCLKMRYVTRQRKCPQCNVPFGENDFHRLYLS